MARTVLILAGLAVTIGGAFLLAPTSAEGDAVPDLATRIGPETERVVQGFRALRKRFAVEIESLERERVKARRAERAAPEDGRRRQWQLDWERKAKVRAAFATRIEELLEPWVRALPSETEPSAEAATMCMQVLEEWMALGEPTSGEVVRSRYPQVARMLAGLEDSDRRRDFLSALATRLSLTPGTSDFSALRSLVEWEALFLRRQLPGEPQLRAVTEDLVLVLTERGSDGILPSGKPWYREGRYLDRGFASRLRDSGDQVRHFAWAFRMFTTGTDRDIVENLLRAKEENDARTRGLPINQADLRLNRAARDIVEQVLREKSPVADVAKVLAEHLAQNRSGS